MTRRSKKPATSPPGAKRLRDAINDPNVVAVPVGDVGAVYDEIFELFERRGGTLLLDDIDVVFLCVERWRGRRDAEAGGLALLARVVALRELVESGACARWTKGEAPGRGFYVREEVLKAACTVPLVQKKGKKDEWTFDAATFHAAVLAAVPSDTV